MVIDPTSNLGQVRLKIGDLGDVPFLTDAVINNELTKYRNNVNNTAKTCAQYILAMLSFKSHKKIVQLEIWGGEVFAQYLEFLKLTIANPNFTTACPIPYAPAATEGNPLARSIEDWKAGYVPGSVVLPYGATYSSEVTPVYSVVLVNEPI